MDITRMIGDTASSVLAQIRGNPIKGEPRIDRSAVQKFLEDLPKSTNGTRALSVEGVIILLPQADINTITSPKTPANTELTLRALVDNGLVSEAGLRSITVGQLLPYLANDQIQQAVKQSNFEPELVLEAYTDKQVDQSRNVVLKPAQSPNVAQSPSVEQDGTPEEDLNISILKSAEQPDSLIHVPARALYQQYVEDPSTEELIQVHEMKAQDLRDLLPPALQAQVLPVEDWTDLPMTGPKIFKSQKIVPPIVRQDLF